MMLFAITKIFQSLLEEGEWIFIGKIMSDWQSNKNVSTAR